MLGSWIVEEIFFYVGILPYNFPIPFSTILFLVGLSIVFGYVVETTIIEMIISPLPQISSAS